MVEWIVFGVILVIIVLWLKASILKVEVQEVAIKVIWGEPVEALGPGVYFIPWCFGLNHLIRVSSEQFVIPIEELTVYSKADRDYGRQPVRVRLAVRLRFPRKGQLMKIEGRSIERLIEVVRSKIPTTEKELSAHLRAPVQEAARVVMGRYTYGYAVENVKEIQIEADNILHSKESVLSKAGFAKEDYQLIVSEIFLQRKIEEAMAEVEERKYRAEAATHLANARAEETMGTLVKLLAKAEGISKEEAQAKIAATNADNPLINKEILQIALDLTQRKMAIDADSFLDIRVPDGTTLEGFIALFKKLFPGSSPGGEKVVASAEAAAVEEEEEKSKEAREIEEIEDIMRIRGVSKEAAKELRRKKWYMQLLAREKADIEAKEAKTKK